MNRIVSIFFVLSLFCGEALTQSIWHLRSDGPMVRIEYLRPGIRSFFSGSDLSANLFTLSGRVPVTQNIVLLAELPYTSETVSSQFGSSTLSGLGNVFLGLEVRFTGIPVFGEFGFRPSTRNEVTGFGSYYGDFERAEAYLKELTTFHFAVNFISSEDRGLAYRVRVGPTIWSPKTGKSTTFIDYGAKVGYDNGAVSVFAGLTGRWNTEATSGKSALNHVGFDVGYRIDRFRPAFFFRLPLDKEISDLSPQTIGGSFGVEF